MARIPLPTPDTMTVEQRAVYEAVVSGPRGMVVGPLRAALHRPELAEKWQQFGAILRFGTSLPARLNELAILATARHWNAQLEFHIHAEAAVKAGLAPSVVAAIREGRRPDIDDPAEADIYDYARQLLATGRVSEAIYRRVNDRWKPVGVVELTAVIGYYTMVAMTLNAHEIPLPDGAAPPLAIRSNGMANADRAGAVTGLSIPEDPEDQAAPTHPHRRHRA